MESTTKIRDRNELATLALLGKFGYLRLQDVSYAIWGSAAHSQMARRTLVRLHQEELVGKGKAPDGKWVYALTVKGANRLQKFGLNAKSTASVLNKLGNYAHRCIANAISLYYAKDPENKIYSEHEIQSGALPILHHFGKIPDYFVDTPYGAIWGEVEYTKKSKKDFQKLICWLRVVTQHREDMCPELNESAGLYLWRVEFICSPLFEKRLMAGLENIVEKKPFEDRSLEGLVEDFMGENLYFRYI
jgi:hypothetical protein